MEKFDEWVEKNINYIESIEDQLEKIFNEFPELRERESLLLENFYNLLDSEDDTPYTNAILMTIGE